MKASIRMDHNLVAVESENRLHAMLELTAPPAPQTGVRPPLNIALVIDRSGSMQGAKLDAVRRCAAFLAERLAPTDRLTLIDFDDEVRMLVPLKPVDRHELLAAISYIEAGGSTNLSGGWLKGMEELGRAPREEARKIVLLTDGQANVGIVDPEALVSLTTNARADSIGTTTIGFGADFSEDLLTAMADAGGGNAHYAETVDAAPAIFDKEFTGLMSLVAQNVSVEIRPSDDVEVISILNDYPVVSVAGGVQIQLGDSYAEEKRRILFELQVPSIPALGLAKIGDVVVRYVGLGDSIESHEVTIPVTVNAVNSDEAETGTVDAEVTEEIVILKAARAQEQARKLADQGDMKKAAKFLREAVTDLRKIAPNSARGEQLLNEAEMMEEHQDIFLQGTYDATTRKKMTYQMRDARRRRY